MTIPAYINFTLAGSYSNATQAAKQNEQRHMQKNPETNIRKDDLKYKISLFSRIVMLLKGRFTSAISSKTQLS